MSKQAKEEAWQYFLHLLESPDLNAVRELMKAVEETHAKEPWIIESLIEFYMSSDSPRALELITSSNRELDKIICKKLHECFEEPSRRRAALRLLVSIICKQPSWLSKITKERIFNDCIRCMKSETDAPALMYATYALTMLLPAAPDGVVACLKDILEAFVRVVHVAYASHNTMPEMYQLNLQVGVYSLFVRLYGMYPWSLLSHLQQHCSKPENRQIFKDAMEPMFEQVRLHPLLITSTSRDKELSKERWLGKEAQDIVAECSSLALDTSEGSCRGAGAAAAAASAPIVGAGVDQDGAGLSPAGVTAAHVVPASSHHSPARHAERGLFKVHSTNSMGPAADSLIAAAAASSAFFSPSENFGLAMPPLSLSHSTTPTLMRPSNRGSMYEMDESHQALARSITASMGLPRASSASLRSGSAGGGGTPSAGRHVTPQAASTTSSYTLTPVAADVAASSSTMASASGQTSRRHSSGGGPGSGSCAGVREQLFGSLSLADRVDRDDALTSSSSRSQSRSEAVPPSPHRKEFTSEPPAGALKAPALHMGIPADLTSAMAAALPAAAAAKQQQQSDECSLSVKSLQQLLEKLSDTTSHCGSEMDDTTDEEVSSINQPAVGASGGAPLSASVTAESVAAFRKTVNRIRFNSTTVTAGLHQLRSNRGRPKSCPESLTEASPSQGVVAVAKWSKAQDDGSISCFGSPTRGSEQQQLPPPQSATFDAPPTTMSSSSAAAASVPPPGAAAYAGDRRGSVFGTVDAGSRSSVLLPPSVDADSKPRVRQAAVTASPARALPQDLSAGDEDVAAAPALASLSSSAELLDEYLRHGAQLHSRLQSRLSLTDQLSTKWTHFGGLPPADEVAILQGQLLMMHTQLLYERQKREQHALRNRRLLRDVTKAVMLQERNEALTSQVQYLEMDVLNLVASMNNQKEELRWQKSAMASSEAQHSQQLVEKAKQMEELAYAHKDLQRRFDSQQAELSSAKKELATTRRRVQLAEQDLQMAGGHVDRVTALEAQLQSLTKQLLLMGELQYKYEERLAAAGAVAGCLAGSSTGAKGCGCALTPGGAPPGVQQELVADIDRLKRTIAQQADSLDQVQRNSECLQQALTTKENAIVELKKLLEYVKAAHAGQIKAMEDKCNAMRAACLAMEQHTVDLYAQIAFLTPPPPQSATSTASAAAQAVGSA